MTSKTFSDFQIFLVMDFYSLKKVVMARKSPQKSLVWSRLDLIG